ncbi:MAG: hypothetical protein RIT04_595 [Candidatus Parcubacteria bacterium]
MAIVNKKEPLFLGLGDLIILVLSLWLTLIARYHELPASGLWQSHLVPFSAIFILSIVTFYAAGLYGRHYTVIVRSVLPGIILKSQAVNAVMAIAIFYFIPAFSVTPKVNLLIYLLIASFLLIAWRLSVFPLLKMRRKQRALVIGSGSEFTELVHEMNTGSRSSLESTVSLDLDTIAHADVQRMLSEKITTNKIAFVLLDLHHPKIAPLLPELYHNLFVGVRFIDIHSFYEEIFDRIPLSCITYEWVLEHISPNSNRAYDVVKRVLDIILATIVGIAALVFLPFVWILNFFGNKGPLFIYQSRVGRNGTLITIPKYRSMTVDDGGIWLTEGDPRVTTVGRFLRKTRIDELPQAWTIFKGAISLIGPRPDLRDLGEKLEKEIPYYATRTFVKPGITGWAQVNQEKPPQSVEETKIRLSYDLFYIKNRSIMLDLRIVLRTIKTLLSRVGM